ncbi:MAG: type II toxin-antitoxin system YafQ family toxin [Prevotellaceae bacterium]|nr:type II toxin-antitoxin system YafQ family toxin [Prevotella sp.]MDD6552332.1 type II toxin-antitoxin system YafQ family toxin [Prevotellaceae bacterium]
MKIVKKSTQFKKDFKRVQHDRKKVAELYEIVNQLALGESIPKENKPHSLHGNYENYMECHIEDDFLLIWYDKIKDCIELVRLGKHSELFGKTKRK